MNFPETKKYISRRVLATIIDYAIVFTFTFYYIRMFGDHDGEGTYTVEGLPALVPVVFWFFYIIVSEYALGGTLGHLIFQLKILSLNNQPPSFGQVVLRRISDAIEISFSFGLIAFILVKSTQNNQRLGDIWAKTIVTGQKEMFIEKKFDFEKR